MNDTQKENDGIKADSFVFYRSFIQAIDDLKTDEERVLILRAITDYALDGKLPALEGYLNGYFNLIKPQIDANIKRRINGNKGGRPKKDNQEKTGGSENGNRGIDGAQANENANVNNNENANNNDNKNSKSNDNSLAAVIYGMLKGAQPKCGRAIPVPASLPVFRVSQWEKNKHYLNGLARDDIMVAFNNYIWVLENTLQYEPQEFGTVCYNIRRFLPPEFKKENYRVVK